MTLADRDARLVRLFAAAVLGRFDVVRALRARAPGGEPDRAWREVVLQVHVFAGFPRLVETYGVLEAAGGLGTIEPDEALGDRSAEAARADGRALFERIYASDAPAVHGMLARHHPDFARWIEEHAYGRVLARPGLEPRLRELCAVAALAVLGQERQLASHVRGALRCGATRRGRPRARRGRRPRAARAARARDGDRGALRGGRDGVARADSGAARSAPAGLELERQEPHPLPRAHLERGRTGLGRRLSEPGVEHAPAVDLELRRAGRALQHEVQLHALARFPTREGLALAAAQSRQHPRRIARVGEHARAATLVRAEQHDVEARDGHEEELGLHALGLLEGEEHVERAAPGTQGLAEHQHRTAPREEVVVAARRVEGRPALAVAHPLARLERALFAARAGKTQRHAVRAALEAHRGDRQAERLRDRLGPDRPLRLGHALARLAQRRELVDAEHAAVAREELVDALLEPGVLPGGLGLATQHAQALPRLAQHRDLCGPVGGARLGEAAREPRDERLVVRERAAERRARPVCVALARAQEAEREHDPRLERAARGRAREELDRVGRQHDRCGTRAGLELAEREEPLAAPRGHEAERPRLRVAPRVDAAGDGHAREPQFDRFAVARAHALRRAQEQLVEQARLARGELELRAHGRGPRLVGEELVALRRFGEPTATPQGARLEVELRQVETRVVRRLPLLERLQRRPARRERLERLVEEPAGEARGVELARRELRLPRGGQRGRGCRLRAVLRLRRELLRARLDPAAQVAVELVPVLVEPRATVLDVLVDEVLDARDRLGVDAAGVEARGGEQRRAAEQEALARREPIAAFEVGVDAGCEGRAPPSLRSGDVRVVRRARGLLEAPLELGGPSGELAFDALGDGARSEELREFGARAAARELRGRGEVARREPFLEAPVRRTLERDELVVEALAQARFQVARTHGALALERRRARAEHAVPRGREAVRVAFDGARERVERVLLRLRHGVARARALPAGPEREPRERARHREREGRESGVRAERTPLARERIECAGFDLGRAPLAQALEVGEELRRRRVALRAVARQALAQDEHHAARQLGREEPRVLHAGVEHVRENLRHGVAVERGAAAERVVERGTERP
ncbi:MAG: carboxymuconolactone decarboxylase family protein, partial [Planctomycetes bacterium]|nr:carboxymuconolactone decarboxylase family protein [Planctomycetota bacterium]